MYSRDPTLRGAHIFCFWVPKMSGSLRENPLGSPAMATLDEDEDAPDLPVTKPRAAPPMGAKAAAPETPASTRPARVQEEGILVSTTCDERRLVSLAIGLFQSFAIREAEISRFPGAFGRQIRKPGSKPPFLTPVCTTNNYSSERDDIVPRF
jgi:hypothetical protein